VMLVIDMAAKLGASLPTRFAALTHDLGKGVTPADILPRHIGHEANSVKLLGPLCKRLRVPTDCGDVALLTARFHGDMGHVDELRAVTCVKLLEQCDALRRPERFEQVLLACEADYRGRTGYEDRPYTAAVRWRGLLEAIRNVDAADISKTVAKKCENAAQIGQAIHAARVAAAQSFVEQVKKTLPHSDEIS